MRHLLLSLPAIALFALAGCVAPSQPAPAPAPPRPVPVLTPAPAPPPPPPASADWRDWPLTPGNWVYRPDAQGSTAVYGRAGQEPDLTLRCDRGRQRLILARRVAAPGASGLTVRTTSIARTLALATTGAAPGYAAAELPTRDALVDAIGFSRGRFVVEGAGQPALVVPAWAEILRVAEDCRG